MAAQAVDFAYAGQAVDQFDAQFRSPSPGPGRGSSKARATYMPYGVARPQASTTSDGSGKLQNLYAVDPADDHVGDMTIGRMPRLD